MKVSIERLEELGLYQRPPDEPEKQECLKGACTQILDRAKGILSHIHKPKIAFGSIPRWQKEGLTAITCVGVIGLTITVVGLGINRDSGPPGTVPGMVQTAYVPDNEVASGNTEDIKVTRMSLMGSGNTVEVLELAAGGVPDEQVSEEIPAYDGGYVEEILNDESGDNDIAEDESVEDDTGDEFFEESESDDEVFDDESDEGFDDDLDDESDDDLDDGSDDGSDDESDDESDDDLDDDESESNKEPEEEKKPEKLLVMANVDSVLNVRADADSSAEQVGVLYKDTGGTVLEQKDGWTKIESGELVGWASDDYLIFGSEAEQKADESGNLMATISAGSLRIREAPNSLSTIIGYVSEDDVLTVEAMNDNGWAEVTYNDVTGYINTEHTSVEIMLATGDTMEAVREKEEARKQAQLAEAEAKAEEMGLEMTVTASYSGTESDLELLATIIYCEAGNQSYEGKVAVGNVVINRVNSNKFPSTFEAVIRAPSQFSPVGSGKFDRVLGSGRVPESCYQAAQEAMDGVSYVGGCLYFKNPKIAGAHSGIIIGDHVFW